MGSDSDQPEVSTEVQELAKALLLAREHGQDAARVLFRVAKGDFPDMEGFLTDPAWAGGFPLWDGVRKLLITCSRPDVREFHVEIGKGGGKSTFAWLLLAYAIGELVSLEDPHGFFGLGRGRPIVVLNVSVSEVQARRTVFAGLKDFVMNCPRLNGRVKPGATWLEFDHGKILAICGHSKSEGMEGYDIYAAVLDEANKHTDIGGKSNADRIFQMLRSSAASRFPDYYRIGTISSSVSRDSFQRKTIDEIARKGQPVTLGT